jgi:sorting nexin-25
MSTGFNRSHILIIVLAVIILPRLSVKVLVLTPIVIVGATIGWVLLDLSLTGWSHKLTIENDEPGTSTEPRGRRRRRLVAPLIFTSAAAWSVIQTRSIWEGTSTSNSTTFPSAPPQLNASLSTLFSHIIKHFVLKWYSAISTSPTFPNAVDQTMKESLVNIVDRVDKIDWSDLIVGRVLPLITEHVESFRAAEYALRGQDLQTPLTESDELDLFFAARYAVQSKLHPAVDVTSPQSKSSEEAWLSELMGKLLPLVMPEREVESRAVLIMTREIIACAVMVPIVDLLSDPDFWNRLIEQKAS